MAQPPRPPCVGNLALTQGSATRDDLLAEMGTGLIITALMGASINPTAGDYSRGASGFWVEKAGSSGRSTNAPWRATCGTCSADPAGQRRAAFTRRLVPSLLVEGLVVAGS